MKKKIGLIVTIILLLNCSLMYGQSSAVLDYLKADDIKGFVLHCNSNEELAIETLMKFSLKDSIGLSDVWFNKTSIDSAWMLRSTQSIDRYYASLKLKSFYWILKIFNSEMETNSDEMVCVFMDEKGIDIFDYEAINPQEQMDFYKRVIEGKKNIPTVKFEYIKTKKSEYYKLEQNFNNWNKQMAEKGLKYMRRGKMSPISNNLFKMKSRNKIPR